MMTCQYFSQPRFVKYFARNAELFFEVSSFGSLSQASYPQNMKYLRFFFACLVWFPFISNTPCEGKPKHPLKSNRLPHWLSVVVLQMM